MHTCTERKGTVTTSCLHNTEKFWRQGEFEELWLVKHPHLQMASPPISIVAIANYYPFVSSDAPVFTADVALLTKMFISSHMSSLMS